MLDVTLWFVATTKFPMDWDMKAVSNLVDTLRHLAVHNLRQYLQELAYHTHQVVREEDQQWEHWEPWDHSAVRERRWMGSK